MSPFLQAHATADDWQAALRQVVGQLERQRHEQPDAAPPTLGIVYFTHALAPHASALLTALRKQWPGVSWAGGAGVGVIGNGVETFGAPALSVLLTSLARDRFRVFSGTAPLTASAGFEAHTALVHADPNASDLGELIDELSDRTATGYLFGGLATDGDGNGLHIADGVFGGGLSGVAFSSAVTLVSRVTQGSQPIGPVHRVSAADGNVVLTLDDRPALQVLLADTGLDLQRPQHALTRLRHTLVGISDPQDDALSRAGAFGVDTRVRHLVSLDPNREAIAVADTMSVGLQIAFSSRNVEAARRDLVRVCSEIREELEPATADVFAAATPGSEATLPAATLNGRRIAGAVYVSCAARGGPHFGSSNAEAQIVRHALGDVPLIGLFAAGEIARHHLYAYTGVLTVFVEE